MCPNHRLIAHLQRTVSIHTFASGTHKHVRSVHILRRQAQLGWMIFSWIWVCWCNFYLKREHDQHISEVEFPFDIINILYVSDFCHAIV